MRESARKHWADPAARARQSEIIKPLMAQPDIRRRIAERTKAALADPDVKARQRAGLKAAFSDPALRRKVSEATKIGMARWRAMATKLQPLRDAWAATGPEVREKFRSEIGCAP